MATRWECPMIADRTAGDRALATEAYAMAEKITAFKIGSDGGSRIQQRNVVPFSQSRSR